MMKNDRALTNNIIFCMATILLIVVITCSFAALVEKKASRQKYDDFIKFADDYDVLFIGTSHVINGIFPMELYKEYGITSYNLGNDASTMAVSYWTLVNALDYCTPSLVVLDLYGLGNLTKVNGTSFDYVHSAFDVYPLSFNKIRMAYDITDDPMADKFIAEGKRPIEAKGEALQLLFNYSIYHSRWNALQGQDFHINYVPEQGASSRIGVAVPAIVEGEKTAATWDLNNISIKYLKMFIDECQNRNIQLLFTYLPFPATSDTYMDINTARIILENYNIEFIDFISEGIINYETDMCDAISHLNPSGARKITRYMGDYITENCNLPNHKILDDNISYRWDLKYEDYKYWKTSVLRQETDIKNYLMLLADKDFEVCFAESQEQCDDSEYKELIHNIILFGGKTEFLSDIDGKNDGDFHICVYDKNTEELIDSVYYLDNEIHHE